jgi:protein arginine kinase activator
VLNNSLNQFQEMMQKAAAAKAVAASHKCPVCGINPLEIEKANQFGCPACYDAFRDDIETMLMNHHGDMIHNGKVPKAWKKRKDRGEPKESTVDRTLATVKRHGGVPLPERIKYLEGRMKDCIKAEDYERAALIRDVVKQMKSSLSEPPPSSTPPSDSPSGTASEPCSNP